MSTNDAFFQMLQDVSAARPFDVTRLAHITGHELRPVPNTAFFASQDDSHPFFRATEMRGSNFVSLEVQPKLCIAKEEVTSRFGDRPEVSFQTHRRPPDGPMYFVYRFPWGKMSFGFNGKGKECLVSVIIDATAS